MMPETTYVTNFGGMNWVMGLKGFFMMGALCVSAIANAQNTFHALVKTVETNEPLIGATVQIKESNIGGVTDSEGFVRINNIPNGNSLFVISYVGFVGVEKELSFPKATQDTVVFFLKAESEELEEVTVETTRSSRSIENIPTRVETISAGELDEKASMQPGNVRMLLTESTGIQTQQTSATSANASIRIQGLDGKYTQLLQNGFPLYSGFSGGLSILQIPPLDLKRVEVIKGSTSTLYGGGAIAGLINFVTKEPIEKKELSFLLNANQSKALDASGFYSQRFKKFGITLFAARNSQRAYDVNKDELSDIPQYQRYSINPRLFYYLNPSTKISLGLNTNFENRIGGDMTVINDKADGVHSYFERNKTQRISSQLKAETKLSDEKKFFFKNSVSFFDRKITKPEYEFSGEQLSSFTEVSLINSGGNAEWIYGGNIWTENFVQKNVTAYKLDSQYWIAGAFIQNNWDVNDKFIVESGLRLDYTSEDRVFALPRISTMYKFNPKLTGRVTGGLGYKMPTIFSEATEERAFQNIEPLSEDARAETSYGGNMDFNYKTNIGTDLTFSMNQLFFYTRLNDPLVLQETPLPNGNFPMVNADGFLDSKGFETNIKTEWRNISLYLGYTFIDAKTHYDAETMINPLTAKNRIYSTVMYEIEDKLRLAYELFYTGQQTLSTGDLTSAYWIMGFSIEKKWEHFSIFANAENFTDVRQSRFESMYTGTLQNPSFRQIWTSTEGFIYNGGIKLIF
jgi:outer membrane receptor for ferrienterochelin and colicins